MYIHTWHTCAWHVCSTSNVGFLHVFTTHIRACMYGGSQRSHEKSLDLKKRTSAQQNVSMFCMLAQKTRQRAAIRPDKVEHFTHTESLSPEIYTSMRIANADNMYVYCTAHFRYAWFRTGLRGNRIAGVRLRGDWLYCGRQQIPQVIHFTSWGNPHHSRPGSRRVRVNLWRANACPQFQEDEKNQTPTPDETVTTRTAPSVGAGC